MIYLHNKGLDLKGTILCEEASLSKILKQPHLKNFFTNINDDYLNFLFLSPSLDLLKEISPLTPFEKFIEKELFFKEREDFIHWVKKEKPQLYGFSFLPSLLLNLIEDYSLDAYLTYESSCLTWTNLKVTDLREEKKQPPSFLLHEALTDLTSIASISSDLSSYWIKNHPEIYSLQSLLHHSIPSLLFFKKKNSSYFLEQFGPQFQEKDLENFTLSTIFSSLRIFSYEKDLLQRLNLSFDVIEKRKAFSKQKKIQHYTQKLSPSKIQTYLDCPKKFYVLYQENIIQNKNFYQEQGINLHEYLQIFFKERSLDLFKNLDEKSYHFYVPLLHKIVNFLDQFEGEFIFEQQIEEDDFIFRPDLIIKGPINYLFDFKYSNLPTLKSIFNYEKIQLLSYYHHLSDKPDVLGYLSLKDGEFILLSTKDLNIKHYKITKNLLNQYPEEEIKKKIREDDSFFPRPRNKNCCFSCPIKNYCSHSLDN